MRALIALLALLALGCLLPSPHVAQDAPAKDPTIAMMQLYRLKGRTWSYRELNWTRAGVAKEQSIQYRVLKASDTDCEVSRSTVADFEVRSSTERFRFDDADRSHPEWAAAALPTVEVKLSFRTFSCKKHRQRIGDVDITTWVSTEFHPLVVRQTITGKDSLQSLTLTSLEDAPADPWLLYRVAGRTWTVRMGTEAMPMFMRTSIKEATSEQSTVVTEILDKDMNPFAGAQPSNYTIKFSNVGIEFESADAPAKVRENFVCKAGEFDCSVATHGETKYYHSVRWSGLLVATDAKFGKHELVSFDLGHDVLRFYRAAGNKLLRRITRDGNISTEEVSVTAIQDFKATVLTIIRDAKGTETGRIETVVDVPEAATPLMPYAQQDELTMELECGTLACIRTVEQGVTSYHHHGLLLLSEGTGFTSEVVELDME